MTVDALTIGPEDPRGADVRPVLERHLAFARATSPACHVHALDLEGLLHPSVTFVAARRGGVLLGVGALKELDPVHGELKSMHTTAEARGGGVGRAILDHLVELARARGYARVSLETGTQERFAAARRLYQRAGFTSCEPFGDYTANPHSACMALDLRSS